MAKAENIIVHTQDELERNGGPIGNGGTWGGPNPRRPRPAMTGEQFDTIRKESAEQRDAAPKMSAMNKIARGDSAALVGELESLIARVSKLEGQLQEAQNQLTLLRGLPPFMANVERR